MSHVRGMLVRLRTHTSGGAGTDEHIYIGVAGPGGGREFPLDVTDFNDFEAGTDVKYWFGSVWDGGALAGAKNPFKGQSWNRPAFWRIEMEQVNQVYVRKASGNTKGMEDDAYKMDEVEVTLYGTNPSSRTFSRTTNIWLGNEYGLQVWLPEG